MIKIKSFLDIHLPFLHNMLSKCNAIMVYVLPLELMLHQSVSIQIDTIP
jgi:hypothetical protein